MNFHKICVYDYETDSPDELTCQPVELAAVMLDPRNLDIIPGSEFKTTMRPIDIDEESYYTDHLKTIEWHAEQRNSSPEKIFESWKEATPQKLAWSNFVEYLDRYHMGSGKKSMFTAPIQAGMNIEKFDCIISDRMAQTYGNVNKNGENTLFFQRDRIDLMKLMFFWFENSDDLKKYNMDLLREYFGLQKEGGHEALKDVKDEAKLIVKFMKLHRQIAPKVHFRGSCNEG